jgi:crotonobetainyl-CoA:carnitine CoA-transferase CaiB-like acyl-CoA transferase
MLKVRTTRQWQELLVAAEVPHAPVWDYAELFAQPQGESRGWRVTVRDPQGNAVDLVGSPFQVAGAELPTPMMPPELGQHTKEVLTEWLELSRAQVADLEKKGVI